MAKTLILECARIGLMNKLVLTLDPRGINLIDPTATHFRLSEYGFFLKKLSDIDKYSLVTFSSSKEKYKKSIKLNHAHIYLVSRPTFNAIKFAILSFKAIKQNDLKVKLLFTTDPWESFVSAYLLRILLKQRIPIYAQIHGDIGHPMWKKINLINWFRYYIAKLTLPRCDGIRVVSEGQLSNLRTNFNIANVNAFVIPIPIKISFEEKNQVDFRSRTIGFVGRIHKDKGVWDFVKLIEILNSLNHDFDVLIVGDGKLRTKFLKKLTKLLDVDRVKFLGYVPQNEMSNVWSQIGVLVSTSRIESYGLVLRESLINGVPIWATKTSGSEELLGGTNQHEGFKFINFSDEYKNLSNDLENLFKISVSTSLIRQIRYNNNIYSERLAKSWLELIKVAEKRMST
jgi:glycosyltransferase involved in cell wall biosynthesis